MGRLFVLRHGETVHNRDRLLQGPRIDAELSELGHLQAMHLALALSDERIDQIYTSPLRRARQTAHAMALRRSQPSVQVVPELYEMDYGNLAGRSYDEVRDDWEQTLDAWRLGYVHQAFPGGESPVLAQHRVRPFASRLRDEAKATNVAVVAHGHINKVLLSTLMGSELSRLEDFPQSNASITELVATDEGLEVVRLNDVSHLQAGTPVAG